MSITQEQFEDWKENPVTEHVFSMMLSQSEFLKEKWVKMSWDNNNPNIEALTQLKGLSECYKDLAGLEWSTVLEMENKR